MFLEWKTGHPLTRDSFRVFGAWTRVKHGFGMIRDWSGAFSAELNMAFSDSDLEKGVPLTSSVNSCFNHMTSHPAKLAPIHIFSIRGGGGYYGLSLAAPAHCSSTNEEDITSC